MFKLYQLFWLVYLGVAHNWTLKVINRHECDLKIIYFQGKDNEFNLLITSEDSEVQIYYYDGWKFQESSIDFTGSAFGAGVVTIRSYSNIIENTSTIGRNSFNLYLFIRLHHLFYYFQSYPTQIRTGTNLIFILLFILKKRMLRF